MQTHCRAARVRRCAELCECPIDELQPLRDSTGLRGSPRLGSSRRAELAGRALRGQCSVQCASAQRTQMYSRFANLISFDSTSNARNRQPRARNWVRLRLTCSINLFTKRPDALPATLRLATLHKAPRRTTKRISVQRATRGSAHRFTGLTFEGPAFAGGGKHSTRTRSPTNAVRMRSHETLASSTVYTSLSSLPASF